MSGFSPSKLGGIIKMAATSMHFLYVSYALFTIICSLSAIDSQVPDGFVYTDQHRTAQKGDQLVLKCQFYGTPVAVFWKKGNDPTKSPNLIFRVEGEPPSGFCVDDQSCSMDDDYSLIINSIKVADEGTYICRVSNYKGILIHNFTEVAVYAPPTEPLPVINECPVKHPNVTEQICSLSTSDSVTITCSALSYFPDIDLFFLQGSQQLGRTTTVETTNPDGTKNKSISTVAEPSDTPYVCFASDIPGSQDQRTVSIEVNFLLDGIVNTTIPGQTNVLLTRGVVEVVLSVVIVIVLLVLVVLCVVALWWHRRKSRRSTSQDDPEAMPLNVGPKMAVREHLLNPITPQEVKVFVYRLTGRHCRRLGEAVGITDENKIAAIIDENKGDLFDTQAMISDWIAEQECTHYKKRCMLDDAVIKIGRHDMTDSFGTTSHRSETGKTLEAPHRSASTFNFDSIFDDDLATLLKHLPSNAISLFLERLDISVDEEDSMEEKVRSWRDKSITENGITLLKKLCSIHNDVLEETKYNKVHDVKDDELENILEGITSAERMEQLAEKLGISNDESKSHIQRLKEWRDKCAMKKRRKTLREALNALGLSGCIVDQLPPVYVYQAEMVRFAYHILCRDVEPLATLLDMDTSKVKTVREPLKGTVGLLMQLLKKPKVLDRHRRQDFSRALRDLGYLDVARSAYFGYEASLSELYNMTSGLSKDEMEKLIDLLQVEKHALITTELHDNLNVMKIWKSQLRPEPIHLRHKLAVGLRAVGRHVRAKDILAGRFRTTEICPGVVENICNNLDGHQMEELCKHLELKIRNAQDDQTAATLVAEWVRSWLNKFDKFTIKGFISRDKLSPRGKENDELFRAGYYELAEEVRLLEVSKLVSVKPAKQEFDEISNEDEAEVNPPQTSNEAQAEVNPNSAESDGASGYQVSAVRSAKKEDEEIPSMSSEHANLIASTTHESSGSSV